MVGNSRGRSNPPHQNSTPRNSPPGPRVFVAQNHNVMEFPKVRYYGCKKMGHYKNKCPRLDNLVAMEIVETQNPRQGSGILF